jgi:hypothetical protein
MQRRCLWDSGAGWDSMPGAGPTPVAPAGRRGAVPGAAKSAAAHIMTGVLRTALAAASSGSITLLDGNTCIKEFDPMMPTPPLPPAGRCRGRGIEAPSCARRHGLGVANRAPVPHPATNGELGHVRPPEPPRLVRDAGSLRLHGEPEAARSRQVAGASRWATQDDNLEGVAQGSSAQSTALRTIQSPQLAPTGSGSWTPPGRSAVSGSKSSA